MTGQFFLFQAITIVSPGEGALLRWQGPAGILFAIAAFALLWVASHNQLPKGVQVIYEKISHTLWYRLIQIVWIMAFFITATNFAAPQITDAVTGNYRVDAIAFIHMDIDLILHGVNPYTDNAAFWQALQRWPGETPTPVLGAHAFGANPLNYPSIAAREVVIHQVFSSGEKTTTAFDPRTVHNYPAGILLLGAPFIWAGMPSLLWLNLLAFAILIFLLLRRALPEQRPSMLTAALLNPAIWNYTIFVNYDVIVILCIAAAWFFSPNRRASAIMMGLACSIKQLAWFFAPFYFIAIYKKDGWKAAIAGGVWMFAVFFAVNLPFIILSPVAWFQSVLVPATDSFYPIGFGPISLALSRDIPFGPHILWSGMEFGVWVGLIAWAWFRPVNRNDLPLIAPLALWFGWRSPMNYFAFQPIFAAHTTAEKERAELLAANSEEP